jgi:predicted Zn-ribbon and HTH transcriptional regulator
MENKNKTPIICAKCRNDSGYFIEDFVYEKVETPKKCKNCKDNILDKPDFIEPIYN